MKQNQKIAQRTDNFNGLALFSSPKSQLLKILSSHLYQKKGLILLFTPNAEQMVVSLENTNFRRYLSQADLLIPDGFSLVLASRCRFAKRWLSRVFNRRASPQIPPPIQERIAGTDLVEDLLPLCQEHQLPILILGGQNYHQVVSEAKIVNFPSGKYYQLRPGLFWTAGFAKKEFPTNLEKRQLLAILTSLRPSVVLVALGAPFQERWLIENRQELTQAGVKLGVAVGGAMDMILGKLRRAPKWMRSIGLEWLYRLYQEPWRWRRQLRLIRFWRVMMSS
ncbi:MAG TPA: WecB/TagA/CpsF family glycosyltransferase [Candidatus Woesebacteria bacterium]|nr:WecB/TagA/CpsF family glycosyltransferase [Candidatus Woesebacteria bacterium]